MSKDWKEKFRPEDLQRLRGFRLMDDDFMSKCFEENIECTELVLQIVLGRDDLKVEKVAIQYQLKICREDQLFLISMPRIMPEKDIMWKSSEQIAVREQREPGITAVCSMPM